MRKQALWIFISFLYGGFLIAVYFAHVYDVVWRGDLLPIGVLSWYNSVDPVTALASPVSLMIIVAGMLFLVNGLYVWGLEGKQAAEAVRTEAYSRLLNGDDNRVMQELQQAGGGLTQKELAVRTGFSRVKMHRAVSRLKNKQLVSVHPFGMTNKVLLATRQS